MQWSRSCKSMQLSCYYRCSKKQNIYINDRFLTFKIKASRWSRKKSLMNQQQKRLVLCMKVDMQQYLDFQKEQDPLLKISIIPRAKGSLGFAQYLPNQNKLENKQQLLDKICFILGERSAQALFFNRITTAAYEDLSKAYQIAEAIVRKCGMSELGYISVRQSKYLMIILRRLVKKSIKKSKKFLIFVLQELDRW